MAAVIAGTYKPRGFLDFFRQTLAFSASKMTVEFTNETEILIASAAVISLFWKVLVEVFELAEGVDLFFVLCDFLFDVAILAAAA
jgi:hypothetical protein